MVAREGSRVYMKTSLIDEARAGAILVMEVNCQGIFELTPHQKLFKKHFPATANWFIIQCMMNRVNPGECILQMEDGVSIMLLVTADIVVGPSKNDDKDVCFYTNSAVAELFAEVKEMGLNPHTDMLVSSIVNRSFKLWNDTKKIIDYHADLYNLKMWHVCTK